jgi:cytochrome c553
VRFLPKALRSCAAQRGAIVLAGFRPLGKDASWRNPMKKLTVTAITALLLIGPSALAATASENWTHHCASCHGADGAGKTKMGKKSGAKDLTSAEYQKSFTDDQLLAHLKAGEKDADGNVKMKSYADSMSDDELKGLLGFVRSLAK